MYVTMSIAFRLVIAASNIAVLSNARPLARLATAVTAPCPASSGLAPGYKTAWVLGIGRCCRPRCCHWCLHMVSATSASRLHTGLADCRDSRRSVSGTTVTRLTQGSDGQFLLRTGDGEVQARSVVVASGDQNVPRILPWAGRLPDWVTQCHVADYRNPGKLPDGAVVVARERTVWMPGRRGPSPAGRRVLLATSRVGRGFASRTAITTSTRSQSSTVRASSPSAGRSTPSAGKGPRRDHHPDSAEPGAGQPAARRDHAVPDGAP